LALGYAKQQTSKVQKIKIKIIKALKIECRVNTNYFAMFLGKKFPNAC